MASAVWVPWKQQIRGAGLLGIGPVFNPRLVYAVDGYKTGLFPCPMLSCQWQAVGLLWLAELCKKIQIKDDKSADWIMNLKAWSDVMTRNRSPLWFDLTCQLAIAIYCHRLKLICIFMASWWPQLSSKSRELHSWLHACKSEPWESACSSSQSASPRRWGGPLMNGRFQETLKLCLTTERICGT